ncbi:hypothetical protein [Halorussus salinus]|uniref:hypothetical protein n=1 Tax=Halorussus salinus TaxID=1364935 RepID=UPI00138EFB75|nr:hypothetical protein [Halorussus salinus]
MNWNITSKGMSSCCCVLACGQSFQTTIRSLEVGRVGCQNERVLEGLTQLANIHIMRRSRSAIADRLIHYINNPVQYLNKAPKEPVVGDLVQGQLVGACTAAMSKISPSWLGVGQSWLVSDEESFNGGDENDG